MAGYRVCVLRTLLAHAAGQPAVWRAGALLHGGAAAGAPQPPAGQQGRFDTDHDHDSYDWRVQHHQQPHAGLPVSKRLKAGNSQHNTVHMPQV